MNRYIDLLKKIESANNWFFVKLDNSENETIKKSLTIADNSQWRTIDSAPRDRYITVRQPDSLMPDQTIVCWDEEDKWWHACDGKNPDLPLRGNSPTHWKLLTESPKGNEE